MADKVQNARRKAVHGYPIRKLVEEYGMTVVEKRGTRPVISTAEHDSLVIYEDENEYHRYSTGTGGDVVAFMMEFSGIDKTSKNKHQQVNECISILEERLKIDPSIAVSEVRAERIKPPFETPEKADTNRRVRAYLCKTRGISEEIVDRWIRNGMLYQEAGNYGNCVFLSRDDNGKPVYGVKRSTNPTKKFVVDVTGSDYSKGFFVRGRVDEAVREKNSIAKGNNQIIVTEAVIDMMSLQSLYLKRRNHELREQGKLSCEETDYENRFLNANWYSLNGCQKYDGLLNTIAENKEITQVRLALDNDDAGRNAAEDIKKQIEERFSNRKIYVTISLPFTEGRDWNDELKAGYSFSAKADAIMDLEEKGMNELENRNEYLQALKYRIYHPREYIPPVNAKDYVDKMIDEIKFRTAGTPVLTVLDSNYGPAMKLSGLPIAEAERIVQSISKHIAEDNQIKDASLKFRIDYEIDGIRRKYCGQYILKSSSIESHGIVDHIRSINYRFINDSRFPELSPSHQAALNFAYKRLVPYLEKHIQVYNLERQAHLMKQDSDDDRIPDNVDPAIIPFYYETALKHAAKCKRILNEGFESEMKNVDTLEIEKMITIKDEVVDELVNKGEGFIQQAVYKNSRRRGRRR